MAAMYQTSSGFGAGLGYTNRKPGSNARLKPLYASSSNLIPLENRWTDSARGGWAAEGSFKSTLSASTSLPSIYQQGPRLDLRGLASAHCRKPNTSWKPEKQTYWEAKVRKQKAAMRNSRAFQLEPLQPLPPRSAAMSMGHAPSMSSTARVPGDGTDSQKNTARGDAFMLFAGAQDHDGWLSATLCSLPSPRRVVNHSNNSKSSPNSQSAPKVAPKPETSSPRRSPPRAPSPPKLPPKAAKKDLRIAFEADELDSKPAKSEDLTLPRSKRRAKRTATQFGVKGGRSVDEVLDRDKARVAVAQGFTDRELARMRNAFRRYRPTDSTEVNREDLRSLFIHLGYFGASAEKVDELATDVHEFTTFSFHEFVDIAEKFVAYERDQLLELFKKYSADEYDRSSVDTGFSFEDSPSQTPTASLVFPESPKRFRTALETPTAKPNSRMSIEKLPALMNELGIIPLKETISEVLASSASDGRPRSFLSYDGYIRFMAVYRVTEGFKKEDVQRAQRVFRSYAKEMPNNPEVLEMGTADLSPSLITLFGTYSSHMVEALVAKLSKFDEQGDDDEDEEEDDEEELDVTSPLSSNCSDPSAARGRVIRRYGISFHEFLIWGRRTLNAIMEELQSDFLKHADGRGRIEAEDIMTIMKDLGFTLTQVALAEYSEDADIALDGDLDFEQFYFFVCAVRERSGFTREEVEHLRLVFEKYDYDASGEIENLELLDLLRFLGYDTSLEDVYRFLSEVDSNANGSMDMPEFLRNLRVKREEDIAKVQEGFETFSASDTNLISVDNVGPALASVNQDVREDILKRAIASQESVGDTLDFDTFMIVSDICRTEMSTEKRKRAAFGEADYRKLHDLFIARITHGGNELQKGEWLWLLKDVGIPIDYHDDRERVYAVVAEARERAIAAGVDENELGAEDGESITLWVFLHVVRCILRDSESQTVSREEGAMDKSRFTRTEVNEFRDVFKASVLRQRLTRGESTDSLEGDPVSPVLPPKGPSTKSFDVLQQKRRSLPASHISHIEMEQENTPEKKERKLSDKSTLSRPSRSRLTVMLGVANYGFLRLAEFLQLLSSISVDLSLDEQRKLKHKVLEITGKEDLSMDFADFLLTMRWILDENLGECGDKFALGGKSSIRGMSSDGRKKNKRKSI